MGAASDNAPPGPSDLRNLLVGLSPAPPEHVIAAMQKGGFTVETLKVLANIGYPALSEPLSCPPISMQVVHIALLFAKLSSKASE